MDPIVAPAVGEAPVGDEPGGVAHPRSALASSIPIHVVKNLFGYRKVRYKGLKKNTAQCFTLFALANLVIAKKHLLA